MSKTKSIRKTPGTSKNQRQFTIRELLTKEHLSSHEDLQRSLKKSGFAVNQATLSRDLAEMGVGRVTTSEGPRYTFRGEGEDTRVRALLSYEVRGIYCNESMIVIKTLSGRAHGVAEMIDMLESKFILGTIAGDNTIFIAPHAMKDTKRLMNELRGFITSE